VYTRWLNLNAADTASLTQLINTFRQSDVLKKIHRVSGFCEMEKSLSKRQSKAMDFRNRGR